MTPTQMAVKAPRMDGAVEEIFFFNLLHTFFSLIPMATYFQRLPVVSHCRLVIWTVG